MNKDKIVKILRSKVLIGVVCFIIGGTIFSNTENSEITALTKSKSEVEKVNTKLNDENLKLSSEITDLNGKVEMSKIYLELDDSEKSLVDKKIDELKKASAEEKAKLKAEQLAKEKAEKEAKEKAEKEAKEKAEKEKKEAEAKKYKTGLTFEDMARNPEKNQLKLCEFKGKILQVMKESTYTQFRMAINGNYDKVVLIEIDNSKLKQGNILEDDYITIKGTFVKETKYTTVMGAERTIPAIVVDDFSR